MSMVEPMLEGSSPRTGAGPGSQQGLTWPRGSCSSCARSDSTGTLAQPFAVHDIDLGWQAKEVKAAPKLVAQTGLAAPTWKQGPAPLGTVAAAPHRKPLGSGGGSQTHNARKQISQGRMRPSATCVVPTFWGSPASLMPTTATEDGGNCAMTGAGILVLGEDCTPYFPRKNLNLLRLCQSSGFSGVSGGTRFSKS